MFILVTLIFELGFESSDDSESNEQVENENQIQSDQQEEEKQYYKFNPPEP